MMNTTEHIEKTTAQPPKKDGFKQTEVGLIPEDWILISYGDAFDFLSSATYSRAELSLNGDIGYIHYGDIHTKWLHFIDLEKNNLPTILEKQKKSYSLVKEGDLVLADASEDYEGIGSSVEVINLKNKKIISGLHTFLLRDKNQIFAPRFKGYINSNLLVKAQIDRLATGLKVYGISRSNLRLVLIPLPPTLVEQRAIATALSDMDALIAAQEALISKKRSIKQGAMQELLASTSSAQGKPKEGWEVKRLGEFIKFQVGYPFSSMYFNKDNKGIRLIKNRDLKSDDTIIYFNGEYLSDFIVENGDVLIGMDGDFIPCYWSKGKGLLNQRVGRLKTLQQIYTQFLFYYLRKPLKKIENRTSSTTVKHLSHGDIEEMELELPNYNEQTRIATILSDMDTEIEQLEGQLAKYREMKKGMMQELLTGKKRLV